MNRCLCVLTCVVFLLVCCEIPEYPYFLKESGKLYDVARDFSSSKNPAGAWSYGNAASPGGDFTLITENNGGTDLNSWTGASGSAVTKNISVSAVDDPGNSLHWEPGDLSFHPGSDGTYCVIRWTAPESGTCEITAIFELIDQQANNTDVHILHESHELYTVELQGYMDVQSFISGSAIKVARGETIDFVLGYGSGMSYFEDSTKIDAQITLN